MRAAPYTSRGVLQTMVAFLAAAPFGSRRATVPRTARGDALVAEIVAEGRVILHTSGTKLERFLRSRGIKPAHVARESGYSRQHLLRVRLGELEPTRRCIVAITHAARRLARENVTAADLFDLTRTGARTRRASRHEPQAGRETRG